MADENHPVLEGIPVLTLHTPVSELMMLCETNIDFKNLKNNGFDFSESLELQGWKTFFERLTGPVYPVFVKKFWVHAITEKKIITSYIMNRKIVITKKSISNLISQNGKGKRIHSAKINAKREAVIAHVIFKAGTNLEDDKGLSANDFKNNIRVWFKTIMGCIHHRCATNSSDYANTCQKFMLFFQDKGL